MTRLRKPEPAGRLANPQVAGAEEETMTLSLLPLLLGKPAPLPLRQ